MKTKLLLFAGGILLLASGVGIGMMSDAPAADSETLPNSEAESRILRVIEDLDAPGMSVSARDGRLLRLLAESINARHVVEIGTFRGYSGLWLALAMTGTEGRLTTFEIDPDNAESASRIFREAGVADRVDVIVGDAHDEIARLEGPIDMAFIDADKSGYPDYLKKLQPLLRPGGLIVAHNVRYPRPDPDFMDAITTDPALETVFLHMDSAGISVSMKKR